MNDITTRSIDMDLAEVRLLDDSDGPKIQGYAAVFDKWSPDYGGFREIIRPGAFKATLAARSSDVVGLFNHDPNFVLGRERSGTMELEEDAKGLRFTVRPPESRSDVIEAVERGDVRGASFSFTVRKDGDSTTFTDTMVERELNAVDLFDVGPVTFPFYPSTKVAVRMVAHWREQETRGIEQTTTWEKDGQPSYRACAESRSVRLKSALDKRGIRLKVI